MKWEEEGYTRKDDHGNIISIVCAPVPSRPATGTLLRKSWCDW